MDECLCFRKKTYESEKMNAYERTEYFLTKEYDDTRIEALGSTDEKHCIASRDLKI